MDEEEWKEGWRQLPERIFKIEERLTKLEKAVGAIASWLSHDTADECKNACKEIYS